MWNQTIVAKPCFDLSISLIKMTRISMLSAKSKADARVENTA